MTDLLPLADIPQHAAQLATAVRWLDDGFPYSAYFEFNWIANSAIPFAVGYVLASVMPVLIALKVLLSIALLGIPLATLRIVRTLDGDAWWVFSSFPISFGFAFMWGFLPFVVAAPIGLLLIDTAIRYRSRPVPGGWWTLVGLVYLLFLSHVLVLAYAGLVSLLIIVSAPTWRHRAAGAAALASVIPLVVVWWVATTILMPGTTPMEAPLRFEYSVGRVPEMLGFMVGAHYITSRDVVFGLGVLALPFLVGAQPAKASWRYAPLGVALLLHFLMPLNLAGTALLYPRFTLFVVPGLLVAIDPAPRRSTLGAAMSFAVAILSLGAVAGRFHAFDTEARDVTALIRSIEPNQRLLTLVDDARSVVFPWFPYVHVGCWYQVERGGIADFSFAEFFPNRFRYRHGMDPPLPYDVEWKPQQFVWTAHGGDLYDYFLVRGSTLHPFEGATTRIELMERRAGWAIYRQHRQVLSSPR